MFFKKYNISEEKYYPNVIESEYAKIYIVELDNFIIFSKTNGFLKLLLYKFINFSKIFLGFI